MISIHHYKPYLLIYHICQISMPDGPKQLRHKSQFGMSRDAFQLRLEVESFLLDTPATSGASSCRESLADGSVLSSDIRSALSIPPSANLLHSAIQSSKVLSLVAGPTPRVTRSTINTTTYKLFTCNLPRVFRVHFPSYSNSVIRESPCLLCGSSWKPVELF